jgi:hypothetical protein
MEKPDKYHYHEAMDRASMILELFNIMLVEHPAVEAEPHIKKKVEEIEAALGDLYQLCGTANFNFKQ